MGALRASAGDGWVSFESGERKADARGAPPRAGVEFCGRFSQSVHTSGTGNLPSVNSASLAVFRGSPAVARVCHAPAVFGQHPRRIHCSLQALP